METKKRAVIYARVSSENDRQDTTRQIKDLESFSTNNDMIIVKIYEEHISGAKKNEERQVLTDCLDYCTKQKVDYLLLSELSRLGRSTLQVLKSLEILHQSKVSVYIQNLGIYSLQPNGEVNPIASILKQYWQKWEILNAQTFSTVLILDVQITFGTAANLADE